MASLQDWAISRAQATRDSPNKAATQLHSGGQKQRVAIASGVMAERPVLLFDEPTSGLDLVHMRQVAGVLRILRDLGKVVIVITHDTELVCEVADRVIRLDA